jgi:alcohol dehydrogenase class IV
MSPADAAECAVATVEHLASDIHIPRGLREYGLRASDIPKVIDEAMKSGNVVVNPRATSKEQLTALLEESL